MASHFAKRILYFSKHSTVIDGLNENEKFFIYAARLALTTPPNDDRGVVSGAAFLLWMFGISYPEDIRNTVTGILRTGNSKTESSKDHDDVTKQVEFAISAMRGTFKIYGVEGKFRDVQKDAKITSSLLNKWLLDGSPLRRQKQSISCAIISLIYEPLQTVQSWNREDVPCKLYVGLLVKLYGNDDIMFPEQSDAWELLKFYVEKFKLSEETEDDVAVEDTNENGNDSTDRTFNDLTARTLKKAKTKSKSRNDFNHPDPSTLIGISYPVRSGHRTIVGTTDDGRPESVPRSQWKKYLSSKCSEQERTDWLKRYPKSELSEARELQKPVRICYAKFTELNTEYQYLLVKSQMGSTTSILVMVDKTHRVYKVEELSREQMAKLYSEVRNVEEETYKPRILRNR